MVSPEKLCPWGLVKVPVCLQLAPALAHAAADAGKPFLQRWAAAEHVAPAPAPPPPEGLVHVPPEQLPAPFIISAEASVVKICAGIDKLNTANATEANTAIIHFLDYILSLIISSRRARRRPYRARALCHHRDSRALRERRFPFAPESCAWSYCGQVPAQAKGRCAASRLTRARRYRGLLPRVWSQERLAARKLLLGKSTLRSVYLHFSTQ